MKVLITGAGGQIGHDLLSALVQAGYDVTATDVRDRPASHAQCGGQWQPLDVTDPRATASVLEATRPEVVFHLAAILSARGEKDPTLAYAVNQTGTWNMLEASRHAGVRRFMFTSSIAAFGPVPSIAGGLPDPVPDDTPLLPSTIYGATKVAGELLCHYYTQSGKLDCRGVRFPGLISASLPGGGSSDYALFMYIEALRQGHYEAFCRPDTRIPLMYMPDAVAALLALAQAPVERLQRSIYNIAAFSPRADEIAAAVATAVPGARFTYAPCPVRQGILDSWPKALDDQAAQRDWGFRPRFDLAAMTRDLLPQLQAILPQLTTTHT